MQTNGDFRFDVSLSREKFIDKTISNAMIGNSSAENRETRRQYGYDSRRGVSFEHVQVTPSKLVDYLIQGHVFCPVFKPYQIRKDGTFGSSQKKSENFLWSNVIGVDIDNTKFPTPEQFIESLSLKPTFWYTSYSNMQRDEVKQYEGPRFRLIYVFNSNIDSPLYFRYCAMKLNVIIRDETGEDMDECNLRCSQYYNGTCVNNESLNVGYGITDTIYDLEDIGVSLLKSKDKDYIDFLCRLCDYKNPNLDKRYEIKREIKRVTGKDCIYDYRENRFVYPQYKPTTINVDAEKDRTLDLGFEYVHAEEYSSVSTYSYTTETILYDWDNRTVDDFKKCSQWIHALENTRYVYRVEKEWGDRDWQWVDDDYFSLFHFTTRQRDRQGRRKSLFERMCLRRLINPEITKDEMVVNTIIDIIRYFDREDGVLNSDFIRNNIESAFSLSVDEIKERYRVSIQYLKKKTRPKRGYILRKGVVDSQEMTYLVLDEIYDSTCSVSDNFRVMVENRHCHFSLSTLYEYCDSRNIKTDKRKLTDDEILDLIDMNLSYRETYRWFKDNGFKVGDKRLRRLYNLKKRNGGCTCMDKKDLDSQINSTTINVDAEKDRTPYCPTNKCGTGRKLTGDLKVDMILAEIPERWNDEWEEDYTKEYYRQKETYSKMNNEEILDDILDFCSDFLN